MRTLHASLLLLVVLLLCGPGQAYRLRYKDVAGATRSYTMTMKMTGITEARGTSTPMDSTTTMTMTEQVIAVKDDCATIKMDMKNGVTKTHVAPPAGQTDEKPIDTNIPDFSMQCDRTSLGKVSNVQVIGKLPLIKGMDNGWINRLVQGASVSLPDKELVMGDSWEDKRTLELFPGAKGDVTMKNTLTGTRVVNNQTDLVISSTMTMSMKDGKMTVGSGNTAITMSQDMDMHATMEMLFNEDIGAPVHSSGKTDIKMKITVPQPTPMSFTMKMAMDQSVELVGTGMSTPSSPAAAAIDGTGEKTPIKTSAKERIHQYLIAAGHQDATVTKSFLSANCQLDLVTECRANAKAGWLYSDTDTKIATEVVDADGESATVKATVVFKGGDPPTFIASDTTFSLVLEKGEWKISGIDPAPGNNGPGVSPL